MGGVRGRASESSQTTAATKTPQQQQPKCNVRRRRPHLLLPCRIPYLELHCVLTDANHLGQEGRADTQPRHPHTPVVERCPETADKQEARRRAARRQKHAGRTATHATANISTGSGGRARLRSRGYHARTRCNPHAQRRGPRARTQSWPRSCGRTGSSRTAARCWTCRRPSDPAARPSPPSRFRRPFRSRRRVPNTGPAASPFTEREVLPRDAAVMRLGSRRAVLVVLTWALVCVASASAFSWRPSFAKLSAHPWTWLHPCPLRHDPVAHLRQQLGAKMRSQEQALTVIIEALEAWNNECVAWRGVAWWCPSPLTVCVRVNRCSLLNGNAHPLVIGITGSTGGGCRWPVVLRTAPVCAWLHGCAPRE
jgi:hypothetical protein